MPDRPRPPLLLVLALLALPQVAETILSPALPALASHWRLDDATSQWTMALFFVGFAPGIWLWGWLADRLGRRPALLGGLGLAALATFGAWASTDYSYLLACRLVQGLGLATCSVTVQASLRDVLQGPALMSYFVTLGAVLAWSPAVGPLGGQWLADLGGHPAVFATLAVLLASLAALVVPAWPETRPLLAGTPEPATLAIFRRVLADRPLQTRALLVAVLNVLVFSFYAAGPFMVGDLPGLGFGWIGLAIAIAGSLGALLNRRLPRTWNSARRVRLGLALAAAGATAQTPGRRRIRRRPVLGPAGPADLHRLRRGDSQPAGSGAARLRRLPGTRRSPVRARLLPADRPRTGRVHPATVRPSLAAGGVLEPAGPGRTAAGQAAAGMKAAPGTPVQTGRPARKAG